MKTIRTVYTLSDARAEPIAVCQVHEPNRSNRVSHINRTDDTWKDSLPALIIIFTFPKLQTVTVSFEDMESPKTAPCGVQNRFDTQTAVNYGSIEPWPPLIRCKISGLF